MEVMTPSGLGVVLTTPASPGILAAPRPRTLRRGAITLDSDPPGGDGPRPETEWAPGRLRRLAATLTVSLAVLGPWPVDDRGPAGSDYREATLDRLGRMPGPGPAGPIRVGLAEVDLTPKVPRPLAGFIGQIRTPFVGVDSPCTARALTIESAATGAATILTADLLLVDARLAEAVASRAGIRPEAIFFTASHTHGGPGGWGRHPLEMLVAGAYDPAYFDELAARLADVVRRSRAATVPAEVAFVEVQARGRQTNRVDPGLPTHDALSALVFRPAGSAGVAPPLAILAVFGAHATVSHPVPPRLGADYPGALAAELKRATGSGSVLFAAGAVGDASPSRPRAPSQRQSAEALGRGLAGDLLAALPSARFSSEVVTANIRLDVDLPPLRLPFFRPWLRFSPAATWWVAGRSSHLHALRVGPAVLVGFPGDYSGHLADRLTASADRPGLAAVATSFDGDFKGYLVSAEVFRRVSCYETRWMSFYGPWAGDYLTDLAAAMVAKAGGDDPGSPRPAPGRVEPACRVGLAALIVAGLILGRPRWRDLARRAGLVSSALVAWAALAVLGFVVAPAWVDWAGVGLPPRARLAALPAAILAARRRRPAPGRSSLAFAAACFFLSASWPAFLATLRLALLGGLAPRARSKAKIPSPPTVSRIAEQR